MEEEMIEQFELGGNAAQWLDVASITKPMKYLVKEYSIDKTEWGNRATIIMQNAYGDEFCITSWNLVNKKKIKIDSIIGKQIELKPFNEKKVLFEVL